jgi:transposase
MKSRIILRAKIYEAANLFTHQQISQHFEGLYDMDIFKQSIGIDVSMDTIEVCYGYIDFNQSIVLTKSKTFKNTSVGHKKCLEWSLKNKLADALPMIFVMEATGVYYENLAHFLNCNKQQVAVVLPTKIRNYAKSLESKSKTDPIDSATITHFALERKQFPWSPPDPKIKAIKDLSREYLTLKVMGAEVKNRIHAKEHSFSCKKNTLKRKQKMIAFIDKQKQQVIDEITEVIKTIPGLEEKITKLESIKGVGFITIVTVLAETNCFEHVTSAKQLASYAGMDVALNDSGKRKGKANISKRGNKFIRHAVFMPALSASRHNPQLKELYKRLVQKGKNKKAALIAVARKLLLLIYALWKNGTIYSPDY